MNSSLIIFLQFFIGQALLWHLNTVHLFVGDGISLQMSINFGNEWAKHNRKCSADWYAKQYDKLQKQIKLTTWKVLDRNPGRSCPACLHLILAPLIRIDGPKLQICLGFQYLVLRFMPVCIQSHPVKVSGTSWHAVAVLKSLPYRNLEASP